MMYMLRAISFINVLLVFNFTIIDAEWLKQNSGTQMDLFEVYFPTPDTGYIVGDSGIILKTIDGGTNWSRKQIPSVMALQSVYFLNKEVGYVVGDSGIIFKTQNGGKNWIRKISNSSKELMSVQFLDSSVGFATEGGTGVSDGKILKTVDGGNNWKVTQIEARTFNKDVRINGIHFPNPDTGFAVSPGGVLKSINGGDNWSWVAEGVIPIHFLPPLFFP